MHKEVLDPRQAALLGYLKNFKRSFYLVGGTAIALYLGHRRSIDFDLFAPAPLVKHRIKTKLIQIPFRQIPIFEDTDQLHLLVNGVKLTFFHYPYQVRHAVKIDDTLTMPSLLSLAAMKAFAIDRRAKWKDYVDMYFILKDHFSIEEISQECHKIFGQQYAEKLFRQQLAFHKDIDYSESVEFLDQAVPESQVRDFLIGEAIRFL